MYVDHTCVTPPPPDPPPPPPPPPPRLLRVSRPNPLGSAQAIRQARSSPRRQRERQSPLLGGRLRLRCGDQRLLFLDPVTNGWSTLASLPTSLYDARSAYAPNVNRVFVFGGVAARRTPRTSTTSRRTPGRQVPTVRPGALPRRCLQSRQREDLCGRRPRRLGTETATTWQYDPVADSWDTSRANIPVAMGGSGVAIVGQYLYVMGTWNGGAGSNLNIATTSPQTRGRTGRPCRRTSTTLEPARSAGGSTSSAATWHGKRSTMRSTPPTLTTRPPTPGRPGRT